jgi:hypothetical protein
MHTPWTLITTLAVLVAGASAGAAELSVSAFKFSDPAFQTNVEVDLTGVAGVTGVEAVMADSTVLTLDQFAADRFGKFSGQYASFAAFQAAFVGDWRLRIAFGGSGTAVYQFNVNDFGAPFTTASFPPAPTLLSPTDGAVGVSATPTFLWDNGGTHAGPLESLFVSVASETNPSILEFESSFGPSLDLNATSWTPSIALPPGAASFLVQYETNQGEDAHVEDPVFSSALSTINDPSLDWTRSAGDLYSRDMIRFAVVPEPRSAALFCVCVCVWGRLLGSRRRLLGGAEIHDCRARDKSSLA